MFDYMTKIRLRSYNARKVVTSSKLEESLTAAKVIAANAITSDPYASYGHTTVTSQDIILLLS